MPTPGFETLQRPSFEDTRSRSQMLRHSNSLTQRYQPNVRMTSLPNIKYDRLQAAIQVIYPVRGTQ
jgi:hypothetical protein